MDIVRCAVVCETTQELCSVYERICTHFKGKVFRVKNAFSAENSNKSSYGYRAILMNVIYENDKLFSKTSVGMIVEIQLILSSYYQVRKNMHLGYSVVRATTPATLAQDSCKLGDLNNV